MQRMPIRWEERAWGLRCATLDYCLADSMRYANYTSLILYVCSSAYILALLSWIVQPRQMSSLRSPETLSSMDQKWATAMPKIEVSESLNITPSVYRVAAQGPPTDKKLNEDPI